MQVNIITLDVQLLNFQSIQFIFYFSISLLYLFPFSYGIILSQVAGFNYLFPVFL